MNSVCIVIRKAPYGALAAAEGVRHLIGAAAAGMEVSAVLVDDGIYVAKHGQDSGDTGWTSLSTALQQAMAPATRTTSRRIPVYVHRPSAETRGVAHLDLTPGVELINDDRLAEILTDASGVLVF
jgi:sulfur relay (sulfurtransferase) DsrF/TusC family protein